MKILLLLLMIAVGSCQLSQYSPTPVPSSEPSKTPSHLYHPSYRPTSAPSQAPTHMYPPTDSPTPAPVVKLVFALVTKMSGIACEEFNSNISFAVAFEIETSRFLPTLDDIADIACVASIGRRKLLSDSIEITYIGLVYGDIGVADVDALTSGTEAALRADSTAGVSAYAAALATSFAEGSTAIIVVDEAAVLVAVEEAEVAIIFTTPSPSSAPTRAPTPISTPTTTEPGVSNKKSEDDGTMIIIAAVVCLVVCVCMAGTIFIKYVKSQPQGGGTNGKVYTTTSVFVQGQADSTVDVVSGSPRATVPPLLQ